MSVRLPRSLSGRSRAETGVSVLEAELLAEKATALGRSGERVEETLRELKKVEDRNVARDVLVQRAADAVYGYFIQREPCGFAHHDDPTRDHAIPNEVLARLGAKPRSKPAER